MTANTALGVAGAFVLGAGILGINEMRQINFLFIRDQTPLCEASWLHLAINVGLILTGVAILGHEVVAAIQR